MVWQQNERAVSLACRSQVEKAFHKAAQWAGVRHGFANGICERQRQKERPLLQLKREPAEQTMRMAFKAYMEEAHLQLYLAR